MKHLFATTALATLLGVASVGAQQSEPGAPPPPAPDSVNATGSLDAAETAPEIAPPEGYVESDVVLTSDNLQGATVHDARGEEIGEVHGLVFANGTHSLSTAAAAGAGAGTTPTDTLPDSTLPDGAGGNAAEDTGRIENIGSDEGLTSPTDTTTPPDQAPDQTTDAEQPLENTAISEAIIDVGGFLGMGEHRVAVPVDELRVFHLDDDLLIYLPWTRAQLEALPEYDEDAAAPVVQ